MTREDGVWLWLATTPGLSAGKARILVEYFGGEMAAWDAGEEALSKAAGADLAAKLMEARDPERINAHVRRCHALGMTLLTPASLEYPSLLRGIYDPPCALYARGNLALLGTDCLTVVGTRKHTSYGERVTRVLAGELAGAGLTIVSGMAEGLDGAAHRAALDAGGNTIAVLGNGLDVHYPSHHAALQEEIAQKGLLLSEYEPGTRPSRAAFPVRNRILAGISRGTLVTEAGEKSGALITAGLAVEYGRELFTVPGNIDSPASVATNRLMRTSAEIVLGAGDVLQVLGVEAKKKEPEKEEGPRLDEEERALLSHLKREAQSFDQLIERTGYSASKLNSLLTMLQLKGIIDQSAGRVYAAKTLLRT
jgi:DNA processing protein